MNYLLSSIRWLRVLGAAVAVVAVSSLVLIAIVTVYALVLALHVRGAPDQNAINHFAAKISPKLMPWLEISLTLFVSCIVARKAKTAGSVHGFFIGILAGLLSLGVILAFGGQLGLHSLFVPLSMVGLGWLGGFVGQKKTGRT